MINFTKMFSVLAVATLVLSGCAREMSSNVYTSSSSSGKVLEGTVLSARQITINESDKLNENMMGLLGGGLAGGVLGSTVGKGKGNSLATIGGAALGATAGAFAQKKLSSAPGMEYVVRIDPKYVSSIPPKLTRREISYGKSNASNDVNNSIRVADTKTDLISVIQGVDTIVQPGQRVLVIYNNDRPRVVPSR